ncbi:hypothetical protein [Modestobacter sp. Leaf380]|uniref:hypothetical protein n=1 Tax=Modestobacter sp. Leaf380 TaxID=1736356 RepID=UPI0012FA1E45|nr:hypothetical protein [Modestobacter sp. Leaf380]
MNGSQDTTTDAAIRAIRLADAERQAAQSAARDAQRTWEAALVAAVEAGYAPSAVAREAGVTRNRVSQLVSAHRAALAQASTAATAAQPAARRPGPRIVPSPLS